MKERIVFMDNIRVLLTFLVVMHHAAQAYGPTGGVWVVSDPARLPWLRHLFFIDASFMMGLYFFIAGYFLVFSLERKTTKAFITDRLKRLGIPYLFFTLVVFLPFNYMVDGTGQNPVSFLIDTYLWKPPVATGHLWFVGNLLMYSMIYLLLRQGKVLRIGTINVRSWSIWLYTILLGVVSAVVRLRYPIDSWVTWIVPLEVAHLPQYLSLFFLGTVAARGNLLSRVKLLSGLTITALGAVLYGVSNVGGRLENLEWLVEPMAESFFCVGISIVLIAGFRSVGNRTGKLLKNLSSHAYGIYLFHLLIVIAYQQALLPVELPAGVKFLLVTLLGFGSSWLISHLLRKIPAVRSII